MKDHVDTTNTVVDAILAACNGNPILGAVQAIGALAVLCEMGGMRDEDVAGTQARAGLMLGMRRIVHANYMAAKAAEKARS